MDVDDFELCLVELEGYVLVDEIMKNNCKNDPLEEYWLYTYESNLNFAILANGLLIYQNRLIILKVAHLRTRIINEAHSILATTHPNRNKTLSILKTRY